MSTVKQSGILDIGYGTVGTAVAFNARGLQFKSHAPVDLILEDLNW